MLVSNRGPIAFDLDDAGNVVTAKTGGGLAAGVRPVLAQTGGMWVCVPLTEADRQSVGTTVSVDGIQVVFADVDADVIDAGVGRVANEYLWFMHHGLTEIAREPTPSHWLAFESYNRAVAECVAAYAPPRAAVLVQDYHLPLVASHLKARDLTWCAPTSTTSRSQVPRCGAGCRRPSAPGSLRDLATTQPADFTAHDGQNASQLP